MFVLFTYSTNNEQCDHQLFRLLSNMTRMFLVRVVHVNVVISHMSFYTARYSANGITHVSNVEFIYIYIYIRMTCG